MIDQALADRFNHPPPEYGPTPLWWWSGGQVTREGIRWQLERFLDGRITNLVLMNLAPKGPTFGAKPDDPVWFSESWWELFSYTCEVAAELKIKLWFYDQIGFSGANVQGQITARHQWAAGQALHRREARVGPEGALPLEPREHLIAVHGPRVGPGWQLLTWADGRVDVADGTTVTVVTWSETAFDYLNRDAVALLIDYVHGEYLRRVPDHVGTTITGSFQDELPGMPTWSAGFLAAFEQIAGYDLRQQLPALWEASTECDQVRADYHRVRTQLAEEAFFRPLAAWHTDRGMLIGADQMNPARAGVPTQSAQLYGDYFATHRWFNAVGSDHEGDARVHSSMADLYDHPRVWIESFHSSGWGGTLEDTWDWLLPFFRSGADLYNPHASYYGLQAGWFEWAPPSTDFRQPYYAVYPQFATAVARTAALLTWGRHAVDVSVLYPSASVQAVLLPDLPIDHFGNGDLGGTGAPADQTQRTYLALAGKNDWFRSAPGLLDGAGVDFDVIDEDSIARATVDDAVLNANGFGFRTVILPQVNHLRPGTAERLVELLEAGGEVIAVGHAPRHVSGRGTDDRAVMELAKHPRLRHARDAEEAVALVGQRRPLTWAAQGVRTRRDGDLGVTFIPGAYPNASAYPLRTVANSLAWDDYDFDPARYATDVQLEVDLPVLEAELWNPATGVRCPLPVSITGQQSTIDIHTGGAPAVFVVWRTGSGPVERPPAVAADAPTQDGGSIERWDEGWTQELVATLDNRWGDFALPAGDDPVPLELWELAGRDGDRDPAPVRVTFGQQVLLSGPFAAGQAPTPLDPGRAAAALAGAELGGPGWTVQTFSLSQGPDKHRHPAPNPKGYVTEEFLSHPLPGPGEQVALRTLLRVDEPGDYDLTLAAGAAKRIWLDGTEYRGDDRGYALTVRVPFTSRVALLEYRLTGFPDAPVAQAGSSLTAYFTLERPGTHVARPEFITPGPGGVTDGMATMRRPFTLAEPADLITVVTGAASALTLQLDGQMVARQEKVQYYESGLGHLPMFFTHLLGPLPAGDHELVITADSDDPDNPLYVDLLAESTGEPQVVVSDASWTAGPANQPVGPVPWISAGLTHAHAALRPHPLAAAHWLVGPPLVGRQAVPFEAAVSTQDRLQTFTVTLPAGTSRLTLPAESAVAAVHGRTVPLEQGAAVFDPPLERPTTLHLSTPPRAFSTGGAVWAGPLRVATVPAPGQLGDWADAGLAAWSGAVRYTRTLAVDTPERVSLDLGRVRGAVEVSLDGQGPVSAFCAPFRFDLGLVEAGNHELSVTVYGTLAPRYDAATPSTVYTPSQLRTGIMGPVRLLRTQPL